jgi:hypothetical protein
LLPRYGRRSKAYFNKLRNIAERHWGVITVPGIIEQFSEFRNTD